MYFFSTLQRLLVCFTLLALLFLLGNCGNQQNRDQVTEETATSYQLPHMQEPVPGTLLIVFEEPDPPPHSDPKTAFVTVLSAETQQAAPRKKRPQVAIIIDDMGHHQVLGERLLALDLNLTYSFLPQAPFTTKQAQIAHEKKSDILVHVPMEPKDPHWNPGKGALYLKDDKALLQTKTQQSISAVPHAIGANNHMGSLFSENRAAMQTVLLTLQKNGFFYIDSFTTAQSKGLEEAKRLNIPTNRRHIFLDNDHDPQKICKQIKKLIQLAQKNGSAIGIGHPNKATLTALTQCDRELLATVDIVGAHNLVQ